MTTYCPVCGEELRLRKTDGKRAKCISCRTRREAMPTPRQIAKLTAQFRAKHLERKRLALTNKCDRGSPGIREVSIRELVDAMY